MYLVGLIHFLVISNINVDDNFLTSNFQLDSGEINSIDSIIKYKETNSKKALEFAFELLKEIPEEFELSIEWKVPKGGNSGIFFKVVEIPEVNAAWKTGPEIQVLDNDNFCCPNTLYHQAPALYDMKPIGKIKFNPHGEWNHLLLKVDHNKNEGSITFNGDFVYSFPLYGPEWDEMVSRSKFSPDKYYENLVPDHPYYTYAPFFGKFKTGKIGLQDHGWNVRFRNIKIREL